MASRLWARTALAVRFTSTAQRSAVGKKRVPVRVAQVSFRSVAMSDFLRYTFRAGRHSGPFR